MQPPEPHISNGVFLPAAGTTLADVPPDFRGITWAEYDLLCSRLAWQEYYERHPEERKKADARGGRK